MKVLTAIVVGLSVCSFSAGAETVLVKYAGPVNLDDFACESVTRSNFINRVCYQPERAYMVILLGNTYYHYCRIPPVEVAGLKSASSMGRYYNAYIKGRYDCR